MSATPGARATRFSIRELVSWLADEPLHTGGTPVHHQIRRDIILYLGDFDVLSQQCAALEAKVSELTPVAECWHALSACYRMTCMGSAGLGPAGLAGYAHITMNLWTGTPEQIRRLIESTGRAPNADEQDKHGRELFGKFIKIAVQNAALVSPTGAT